MIGAQALARMRFAGKRPVGGVIVTEAQDMAAHFRKRGFCSLIFDPSKAEDWRVLKALDVAVVTRLKREQVSPACQAILDADPRSFRIAYHGDFVEHEVVIAAR